MADKVGFALAPDNGMGKRSNWLWAWALAIPAGTQKEAAAKQFIEWATSNGYIELVASKEGWAVPSGRAYLAVQECKLQGHSFCQDDTGLDPVGRS